MTFSGSKLKALREERHISREQVAVAVGAAAATIRNWEQGVHIPDANSLHGLAGILGVPMDAFYEKAA